MRTASKAAPVKTFTDYCPLHEFDRHECDEFCIQRREALWLVDVSLRAHWARLGFPPFDTMGRAK